MSPAAATPPTPENVAEWLTGDDNDYDDGNHWAPGLSADGNVVHIGITPYSEDGDKLDKAHFEAHVFAVEPAPPVAAEPVLLPADLARGLADGDIGGEQDGWTVVANTMDGTNRWSSLHTLIIRNAAGEHFSGDYEQGLTEHQDYGPWEYDKTAEFLPVARRVKVVQSVEWVKPAAEGELLIDPDCKAGKCASCVGGPCEHNCHEAGGGSK